MKIPRDPMLDEARYWRDVGIASEAEYEEYAHLWQTSAPRFDLRACHCDDCVARYPHHKTLP